MLVFVKSNYSKTGLGRLAYSLKIHKNCEIIYIDKISDTNQHKGAIGLFCGFMPSELFQNYSVKNKYYLFCSPFGQAELSFPSKNYFPNEILLLRELYTLKKNNIVKNIITPSKSVANRMGFIYLPPIRIIDHSQLKICKDRKNYGFLGDNIRRHKNVFNQIAAISMLLPKEPIIVDYDTFLYYGETCKELFDCELQFKDGLSDDNKFIQEIKTHRLGFQCSWSESFDYLALEYCLCGVPIICSYCIDWFPPLDKSFNMYVHNNDSYIDILNTSKLILSDESFYWELSEHIQEFCTKMNEDNKEKLMNILNNNFFNGLR